MAEAVQLKYHRETFALLGAERVLSPSAVEQIEAVEQRCGRVLPPGVREWYSLEGVHDLVRYYPGLQ
jgi:hypothetical protein